MRAIQAHLIDGIWSFMGIKNKFINLKYLIFMSILFAINISANTKILGSSLVQKEVTSKNIDSVEEQSLELKNKDPLREVFIDFSKIFDDSNNLILEIDQTINDPIESDLLVNSLVLKPGQYIQLIKSGQDSLLSDGSILIKFNSMPNFDDYTSSGELIFVSNLSDINTGVFKVKNILKIKPIIDSLKDDDNISSISLNTINYRIKPE